MITNTIGESTASSGRVVNIVSRVLSNTNNKYFLIKIII